MTMFQSNEKDKRNVVFKEEFVVPFQMFEWAICWPIGCFGSNPPMKCVDCTELRCDVVPPEVEMLPKFWYCEPWKAPEQRNRRSKTHWMMFFMDFLEWGFLVSRQQVTTDCTSGLFPLLKSLDLSRHLRRKERVRWPNEAFINRASTWPPSDQDQAFRQRFNFRSPKHECQLLLFYRHLAIVKLSQSSRTASALVLHKNQTRGLGCSWKSVDSLNLLPL